MDQVNVQASSYWDAFYRRSSLENEGLPSQFAAFVLGEYPETDFIIDIGCGSGRDSFFFASFGRSVLGVDASESAVKRCEDRRQTDKIANIRFIQCDIAAESACDTILAVVPHTANKPLVYARFFLHAIDEHAERAYLRVCARLCRDGGSIAAEFRTYRDTGLAKVTPDHYRRYIDPLAFMKAAAAEDFTPTYFVEGFGLAKYKSDDAHVARCLLTR